MQSGSSCLRPQRPLRTQAAALAAAVDARCVIPTAIDAEVTGIEQRSAHVQPGDIFVAMAGSAIHGARFAAQACDRGASAVLTDPAGAAIVADTVGGGIGLFVHDDPRRILGELSARVYGDPSERLCVIGITGTAGKTTTSYLVEAGLVAGGHRTALIGTIGTRIDTVAVDTALTTPEAPQLQGMFAAMLEQGITTVVMEVSSHALALGRVDGIHFDVGAFTNLSRDHLDFHDGFEDYFAAKARLFAAGSPVRAAGAVVCVDDQWGRRMAELAGPDTTTVATTDTTAAQARATWRVTDEPIMGSAQQTITIHGPVPVTARLRLPGRYNVANAAVAVAICAAVGVAPAVAADAFGSVDVPGRLQRIDRNQDFLAVVDYAHKPAAVAALLDTLRDQLPVSGRLGVVIGAGGDRDAAKRPLMGEAAARRADLVVITDDNPRSEDPAVIRTAVAAGAHLPAGEQRGEVRVIDDRAAAIAAAVNWARRGDIIVVAGKGHEAGQEIRGVKYPFDDRLVLAEALDMRAATSSQAGNISS